MKVQALIDALTEQVKREPAAADAEVFFSAADGLPFKIEGGIPGRGVGGLPIIMLATIKFDLRGGF